LPLNFWGTHYNDAEKVAFDRWQVDVPLAVMAIWFAGQIGIKKGGRVAAPEHLNSYGEASRQGG